MASAAAVPDPPSTDAELGGQRSLCGLAESFLDEVYDEPTGLFPFTTSVVGGRYVSTYNDHRTPRYTITSLLGLQRAAAATRDAGRMRDVDERIDRFTRDYASRLASPADTGLLLMLLAQRGDSKTLQSSLSAVAGWVDRSPRLRLHDLAWLLWGSVSCVRAGERRAADVSRGLFRRLADDFVTPVALATNGAQRHRGDLVSFGSTAYFLRALNEYAQMFDDARAHDLFDRGIRSVLDLQGPSGEWPWLIRASTGAPAEVYPIYTVHQDSMSMLFLLPALDAGADGVHDAVERSFGWVLGRNELATPMISTDPFTAYRSIERRSEPESGGFRSRLRRYVRARRADADPWRPALTRVNRECRSYHVGWLLYAWADRTWLPGSVAP